MPLNASYASIVQNKDSGSCNLTYYEPSDHNATCAILPVDLTKQAAGLYKDTLYGYFLGPRLYFPTVKKVVQSLWGKLGLQDAMMNDAGFLFFKFNNADGMRQVLEGGPWMIKGVPLFVFPWDPQQGLIKPEHKSCPLWVKIHNIPLVAFNREGVGRIASLLGVPKQMDDHTTKMCDEAWGRPSFAKVLVDVRATGDLKRDLQVSIPSLYGGPAVSVPLKVEYMWEPTQCLHCKVFGHKSSTCVKALAAKKKDKEVNKQGQLDDGFKLVTNKKKQNPKVQEWRPVEKGSSSNVDHEPIKTNVDKETTSSNVDKEPISSNVDKEPNSSNVDKDPISSNVDKVSINSVVNENVAGSQNHIREKVVSSVGTSKSNLKDPKVISVPLGTKLKSILKQSSHPVPLTKPQVSFAGPNKFAPLEKVNVGNVLEGDASSIDVEDENVPVTGEVVTPLNQS